MKAINRKIIISAALALIILFFATQAVSAQEPYWLVGHVYNSTGVAVPEGVTVYINDTTREGGAGYVITAVTDTDGKYKKDINVIPNIADGDVFICNASYMGEFGSCSFVLNRNLNLSQQCDIHLKAVAVPPTVTVRYPNGGESIERGTPVNVSAHATDDVEVTSVVFYYSSDGGTTWKSIGSGTLVDGNATDGIWNATWNTTLLTPGSNYLIKAVATDNQNLTASDRSNATFTILPAAGEYLVSIVIREPWDQVPIHVNDPAITDALSLVIKINETAPNRCKEVVKWDASKQKFVSYVPGVPLNNFAINGKEETPFAHVTADTTITFTGTPWWS